MTKKSLSFIIALGLTLTVQAQKPYFTNGGEFLFQFAEVSDQGNTLNNTMRFTLFFHTGSYIHYDFNTFSGVYTGMAVRNVGYIVKEGDITTKRRAYSLGVPVALKLGKMSRGFYLYGGGEYEWFFHYKEKILQGGTKTKMKEWFSARVNTFVPSVFGGIQFNDGLNIKVKFYLDDFMNTAYRDNNGNYPYSNLKTSLFYISLSWNVKYKPVVRSESRNASFASGD